MAMGRAVPSLNPPTSTPLSAARQKPAVPSRADALPACAAWRDSAPTAELGITNPMLPIATTTGSTTP